MAAVRTLPGITRRMLIAFLALTLLPAGVITWLGLDAVGRVIEQRLIRERPANVAYIIGQSNLRGKPVMQRLALLFGKDDHRLAARITLPDGKHELDSSMNSDEEREFAAQLGPQGHPPEVVRLGGHEFVVGHAEIRDPLNRPAGTLYLLMDRHVLNQAKSAAVRPILMGGVPIVLLVLAAGFYVARTITRPIRKLSSQIEARFPAGGSDDWQLAAQDVSLDAPRELADLAQTFNRMFERLRQMHQRLVEAERLASVGKIASSVAHEVRNPLAGMRMNLQLLSQHLARSGAQDESLTIAIAELDRVDAIVQEMLILGKKAQPRLEIVDLHALADEMLQLMERRLRHAGVQADIQGTAATTLADPSQLKQVVLNLVLNALDAMPQGGRLTIRTQLADATARLEIDDTGSGITLEAGQDPFAWFSTSKSAGHGIGLAVCKQIIDAHRGQIGLQRLDNGTRAWFALANAKSDEPGDR